MQKVVLTLLKIVKESRLQHWTVIIRSPPPYRQIWNTSLKNQASEIFLILACNVAYLWFFSSLRHKIWRLYHCRETSLCKTQTIFKRLNYCQQFHFGGLQYPQWCRRILEILQRCWMIECRPRIWEMPHSGRAATAQSNSSPLAESLDSHILSSLPWIALLIHFLTWCLTHLQPISQAGLVSANPFGDNTYNDFVEGHVTSAYFEDRPVWTPKKIL